MKPRDKFISTLVADALDGLALYLERRAQQRQAMARNPFGTQPWQVGAYQGVAYSTVPAFGIVIGSAPRKEPLRILDDLDGAVR